TRSWRACRMPVRRRCGRHQWWWRRPEWRSSSLKRYRGSRTVYMVALGIGYWVLGTRGGIEDQGPLSVVHGAARLFVLQCRNEDPRRARNGGFGGAGSPRRRDLRCAAAGRGGAAVAAI